MSHADREIQRWHELARRHDAAPDEDFPGWREAREELGRDGDSRRRALDADPLFLFQSLPHAGAAAADAAEVADMKAAVAHLRRTGEVGAEARERARAEARAGRRRRSWFAAALAAVALPAAWLLTDRPGGDVAVSTVATAPRDGAATADWLLDGAADLPLIEDLEHPAESVLQIEDEQMTMVVVWAGHDLPVLPPEDV